MQSRGCATLYARLCNTNTVSDTIYGMELIKRNTRSFGRWAQQLFCFAVRSRLYSCYIINVVHGQGYICLHLLQIECVVCLCFVICFREGYCIAFAATGWHGLFAVAAFHLMVVIFIYRYIGKLSATMVERQADVECAERITNQYKYAEYLFQNSEFKSSIFFYSQLSDFQDVYLFGIVVGTVILYHTSSTHGQGVLWSLPCGLFWFPVSWHRISTVCSISFHCRSAC